MQASPFSSSVTLIFLANSESLRCSNVKGDIELLTGYNSDDFLSGKINFETIFHPHDRDIRDSIFSITPQVKGVSVTFRLIQKTGKIKIVRSTYERISQAENETLLIKITLQDPINLREDIVDSTVLTNFIAMMETTDDFIYFKDRNHVFTGASQTLVKVTDPTKHWTDLIGKTDYEVFPTAYADIYYTLEKKVFSGLIPVAQEVQPTEDINGNRGWVDNRKYPIKDKHGDIIGLFGIARDITRLITAEELAKQSQLMSAILNSIEDAVVTCDLDGNATLVNRAAREMFGLSEQPTKVHQWMQFVTPIDATIETRHPNSENPLLRALEGETIRDIEACFKSSRGKIRYAIINGNPLLNTENQRIGAIISIHDITDRILAENKLKNAMAEVESATKAKSSFLARMSHEIRTPIHSILGLTDILLESGLNEEQRQLLSVTKAAGENLSYLINDILDLSKVEADAVSLDEVPFSIRQQIGSCLEIMSAPAFEKTIRLNSQIEPAVPNYVIGDPIRFRQILLNLLSNAIKFSHSGVINVTVESAPVSMGQERLLFMVSDEGIGIPKDQYENIFEQFTQLDASLTRKLGGSGLGLAISKRLVELMHGKIWVESKVGKGSTFYFTARLPNIRSNNYSASFENFHEQNKMGSHQLSFKESLKILLVDDSKENRLLIGLYLKGQPHHLIEAENGFDAVELYKTNKFDLILMDVQMPIMDGYAATRNIRNWETSNNRIRTPILALTANAFNEDIQASRLAGCDEHVAKPLKKEMLLQLIRKFTKIEN